MEASGISQQSTVEDGVGLPPEAALAYFEPPLGVHAAAGQARQEKRVRYGFRVGQFGLLINPDAGSEVLEMPSIASMPGAPPGFLGLVNLRSNLVPLFELRVLLDMAPREPGASTMVLVFGQGKDAVGVIIEGSPIALAGLHPLPNSPPLPDALQNHVPGGYLQDETVWLEFDHNSFFDEICRAHR